MTTQFKKFLIGLLSLGCGLGTFFGLLFFAIPKDAGLAGLVFFFFYLGLAIGSIFIYYALFKRVFSRYLYGSISIQPSTNKNTLWANKVSILAISTLILGRYLILDYGIVFIVAGIALIVASLLLDQKIGKLLTLGFVIFYLSMTAIYAFKYRNCPDVIANEGTESEHYFKNDQQVEYNPEWVRNNCL